MLKTIYFHWYIYNKTVYKEFLPDLIFLISILVRKSNRIPAVKAGKGAVYSRMGFLSERKEYS